jgi:hypothetical protein
MLIESSNKIRHKYPKETVDAEETTTKEKKKRVRRRSGPVAEGEKLRFFNFEENVRVWINKNPAGEIQLGFTFKCLKIIINNFKSAQNSKHTG